MSNAANTAAASIAAYAKHVRKMDKVTARQALPYRVEVRICALNECQEAQGALYALAWGTSTGRATVEFERALMDMGATDLLRLAVRLAAQGGSIASQWEAWKRAVAQ